MLILLSCSRENLPPVARLVVFPLVGDSTTFFEFRAGASTDDRNYSKSLRYRWDYNQDGIWDTEFDPGKTLIRQFAIPGIHSVAVEVTDLDGLTSIAQDTVEVIGLNRDIDTLTDPRDGNKYRIVKVQEKWWMAENLRYGTEIPTSQLPGNNGIVEMYTYRGPYSSDPETCVYHWFEAMNYQVKEMQGICPDGWHIPSSQEWNKLFAPFPYLYALQFYGKEGLSGLNLDRQFGATRWEDGSFWWARVGGGASGFWTSSYKLYNNEYHPIFVLFTEGGLDVGAWQDFILSGFDPNGVVYYTLRCVKDTK